MFARVRAIIAVSIYVRARIHEKLLSHIMRNATALVLLFAHPLIPLIVLYFHATTRVIVSLDEFHYFHYGVR